MGAYQYTRRMRDEEVDAEGTWAVSYGDMVTLLLTFFIIFFSIDPSQNKNKEGDSDFQLSFGEALKLKSNSEVIQKKGSLAESAISEEVIEKLKGKVVLNGKRVIIDFPEVSFFKSGKIPLTSKGIEILQKFSNSYSNYMNNYVLVIQAYTDIKKVRLDKHLRFTDNLELSALRGVSTMRVLQKSGIPLKKMRVAGYGEMETTIDSLLKSDQNTYDKRKLLDLARRVVLVIEPEVIK